MGKIGQDTGGLDVEYDKNVTLHVVRWRFRLQYNFSRLQDNAWECFENSSCYG